MLFSQLLAGSALRYAFSALFCGRLARDIAPTREHFYVGGKYENVTVTKQSVLPKF
jgi:hypothetical protein